MREFVLQIILDLINFLTPIAFDLLQLLISLTMLIYIILAYKAFLSQHHKKQQVDVVSGLITQIHSDLNIFHFNHSETSNYGDWRTIFDITESNEMDKHERIYFHAANPDDKKETLNWDFFRKYYANPLLPIGIAKKLKAFNIYHWKSIKYKEISKSNCIIIGNKGTLDPETSCLYIENGKITTTEQFKKSVYELKKEIVCWLRKYGIKDINITKSHVIG